jgi:hypothetical protein
MVAGSNAGSAHGGRMAISRALSFTIITCPATMLNTATMMTRTRMTAAMRHLQAATRNC